MQRIIVTRHLGTGQITPEKLVSGTGSTHVWQDWTFNWTSDGTAPAIGNGTIEAKYIQVGKIVFWRVRVVFGSTTAFGTGSYFFDLPVTARQTVTANTFPPIGLWQGRDVSASSQYGGHGPALNTTTKAWWGLNHSTAAVGSIASVVGASTPFTWANTDQYQAEGFYEAA